MLGRALRHVLLVVAFGLLMEGCSGRRAPGVVVDPDAIGNDGGTLVSSADVRVVAEEMIQSMNQNQGLGRLLQAQRPLTVLVGDFKQRTSITIFDKKIFLNHLLSRLISSDRDGNYVFMEREPVIPERSRQSENEVASAGLERMPGAKLVLSGEIRELFHRTPLPEGGERQKRSVQYTMAIDRVSDSSRVWAHSHEIVKEQVIGALYQ